MHSEYRETFDLWKSSEAMAIPAVHINNLYEIYDQIQDTSHGKKMSNHCNSPQQSQLTDEWARAAEHVDEEFSKDRLLAQQALDAYRKCSQVTDVQNWAFDWAVKLCMAMGAK